MPITNNLTDYEDIRPILDQAIASERGKRLTCLSHGQAVNLRQRIYKLRQLERRASVDVYDIDHPLRGLSPWEDLIIEVGLKGTEDENILILRKAKRLTVEDL